MPESFSEKLIMQIKMNSIKKHILEFRLVSGKGALPFSHGWATPDIVGLSALATQCDREALAIDMSAMLLFLPLFSHFSLSSPCLLKHTTKS